VKVCRKFVVSVQLQMLSLLEHMYHELQIVKEFNINPITLKRWLVSLSVVPVFDLLHINAFACRVCIYVSLVLQLIQVNLNFPNKRSL